MISGSAISSCFGRRLLAACVAAVAGAAGGCAPVRPALFDAAALKAARRVVVLPLADAPGQKTEGSGKSFRAVIEQQLLNNCEYDVIHLPKEKLDAALKKTGLSMADCYDPAVAAELARSLGADAAVAGELLHYAIQREMASTTVVMVSGGGTEVTHWVSVSIRLTDAKTGRIIYAGTGTAQNAGGFTKAATEAARQAFAALAHFRQHLQEPK